MIFYYRTYILFLIVSLFLVRENFSQSTLVENDFLHQNFIVTLEGGINYGFTDYKNASIGPSIRGSIEYYPIVIDNARFGLKIFGGGLKNNQSDDRGSISNNDLPNPRTIPADIYTDMIQIGGSVNIGYALSESFIPYLSVGAAYLNFSPKNSNGTILSFNSLGKYNKSIFSFVVEGGLKYKLNEQFSINAALSYYPTTSDYLEDISASKNTDSFLSALIGVSYAFVGNYDSDNDGIKNNNDLCPDTPQGVKVDEFGCPIDSDKDGVPDYLDKCSDTPIDIVVNANGCPPDKDNDGVPDYLDKCPDTPESVVVDQFGCPVDSDKDGVPDYKDKCPDTPINTKVDLNGCPQEAIQQETFYQFILRGDDTFTNNSSSLKDGAKLLLNEIAFYIKNQPRIKWRIEGYMDNQGSASLLKKLSYDRAKAIYDYLISKGSSPDQFTIYGLGNSSPIANNNSEEGRSTNRRILIIRED